MLTDAGSKLLYLDFIYQFSPLVMAIQCFLYAVLMVLGIFFNISVIWLVNQKRSLQTITNMWVVSLCISHLFTCATSLPIALVNAAQSNWLFGEVFCRIYGYCTLAFRTVSIFSLTGIALDRYNVISRPFSKRVQRSKVRRIILLTWWAALLVSAPPLTGVVGSFRYSPNTYMCQVNWMVGWYNLYFAAIYIPSVFVQTIISITWSYSLIYKITASQAKKHKKPATVSRNWSGSRIISRINCNDCQSFSNRLECNCTHSNRLSRASVFSFPHSMYTSQIRTSNAVARAFTDNKANKTIAMVLSVYLLSWSPYFAFALYGTIKGDSEFITAATTRWFEYISTCMSLSTCVWDPLLYGACTHNFKSPIQELFFHKETMDRARGNTLQTRKISARQLAARCVTTHIRDHSNLNETTLEEEKCTVKRDFLELARFQSKESLSSTENSVAAKSQFFKSSLHQNSNEQFQKTKSFTSAENKSFEMEENATIITHAHTLPHKCLQQQEDDWATSIFNYSPLMRISPVTALTTTTFESSRENLFSSLPTNNKRERNKRKRRKTLQKANSNLSSGETEGNLNVVSRFFHLQRNFNSAQTEELKIEPDKYEMLPVVLSRRDESIGSGPLVTERNELESGNTRSVKIRLAQQRKT